MQWVAFGALGIGLLLVLLRMTRPIKHRNRGPSNEGLTDYGSQWLGSDDGGHHTGTGLDGGGDP